MKALVTLLISVLGLSVAAIADDLSVRAWQMESKGDAAGARDFLQKAAQSGSADGLEAYAQFLDSHHDPSARDAYEKLVLTAKGEQRLRAARRLVLLDLMAGDRAAAQAHLDKYHDAGGGAQCCHQRISGSQQQRSSGADRIFEVGYPLSFPGTRARETGRSGWRYQDRNLRIGPDRRDSAGSRLSDAR